MTEEDEYDAISQASDWFEFLHNHFRKNTTKFYIDEDAIYDIETSDGQTVEDRIADIEDAFDDLRAALQTRLQEFEDVGGPEGMRELSIADAKNDQDRGDF